MTYTISITRLRGSIEPSEEEPTSTLTGVLLTDASEQDGCGQDLTREGIEPRLHKHDVLRSTCFEEKLRVFKEEEVVLHQYDAHQHNAGQVDKRRMPG